MQYLSVIFIIQPHYYINNVSSTVLRLDKLENDWKSFSRNDGWKWIEIVMIYKVLFCF